MQNVFLSELLEQQPRESNCKMEGNRCRSYHPRSPEKKGRIEGTGQWQKLSERAADTAVASGGKRKEGGKGWVNSIWYARR